jgi:hypothetical protein
MRLVLLISLCLLAGPATAGPVIGAALTFLGASQAVITFAQIAFTIGSMVYGAAQQRRREREQQEAQRNAYNASLKDHMVSGVATESPAVYVLGRAKVGGSIVAILTSGDRDQYKHIVTAHAAHEIDGYEEHYLNNKPLGTLDANGYVTGGDFYKVETGSVINEVHNGPSFSLAHVPVVESLSVVQYDNSGEFPVPFDVEFTVAGSTVTLVNGSGGACTCAYTYRDTTAMVRVKRHLGTAGDPADATLMAELPAKWFSTSRLQGCAYTITTLNLNHPEFQGGLPSIHALVRGMKLYDVRTGLTTWNQNNVNVAYWYLTSDLCGVDAADLPMDQYIAAANVCDEAMSFGAKYTFNGVISAAEVPAQVLEQIAQSMAGGIVATTWDIYAGKYVAPVLALQQEDLVGRLATTSGASTSDLYNIVRGQYISPDNSYVATDYTPYRNDVYLTSDGEDLATNIDFPYTNGLQRVHNLARIFTEDQRNGFTLKGVFSFKAIGLRVGDRITFTSEVLGQTAKVYRVMDKSFSASAVGVDLTLKEDSSLIWDEADAVEVDETPSTDLPNPFEVAPLENVVCESGTDALLVAQDGTILSRIHVSWDQATNPAVLSSGSIEVEWAQVGTDVWHRVTVQGDSIAAYISPVQDGFLYVVRARAVSPYFNIKSDWRNAAIHTVIGKTEPPSDVPFFSVDADGIANWGHVDDVDLAGYAIRWQQGNNLSWGDASPLHAGVITESPYQITIRPAGSATYMIKAVDTSGNQSETAAACIINLGDPIVNNVIVTYDYQANSWPGTLTVGAESGGNLVGVADASPLAWDPNPNTAGWTLDTDPGWTLATYGSIDYQADTYIVAEEDDGAQLTLSATIAGTSYLIEYRRDGDALAWTSDDEPGWTDDADAGWLTEDWRPWPGAVTARPGRYQFRITVQSRDLQGVVSSFVLKLDVPDQVEIVGQVSILAGGTVIPTTKTWRSIENINLTLVADAGTARSVRIENAQTRTVTTRDSANTSVNGTVLATLQGY